MTELLQLVRPVVRRVTGLHPNQVRTELGHEHPQVVTRERLAHHDLPARIAAVYPEDVFCEINSHCRNLHRGRSSLWLLMIERTIVAHRARKPCGERSIPSLENREAAPQMALDPVLGSLDLASAHHARIHR